MEEWRTIAGYEGLYEVSNYGRIKSLQGKTPRILIPSNNSKGYLRVSLWDRNGKHKRRFVHRVVAEAFLEHDKMSNVVNHLDFNPHNNNADNLEWTTQKLNIQYSNNAGRFVRTDIWKKHLRETNEKNGKAVIGTSLDGMHELFFICLNDVKNSGFQPSCVCNCCNGIRTTHKGYTWRYATRKESWQVKEVKD